MTQNTPTSGRRRDAILRVIDDDPRLFGLRSRSLLVPTVVLFGVIALAKANIRGVSIVSLLFGDYSTYVCVFVVLTTVVLVKYVETMEDEHFVTFLVRYVVRKVTTWLKGRYSGAASWRPRPHVLDDVLTYARLSRVEGVRCEP